MTRKLVERENVTKPTKLSARDFVKKNIYQVYSPERQKEILEMVKLYEQATGEKCVMWNKIFGFGSYNYIGKSTKGVWMASGFAVPKTGFTIYTIMGHKNYPEILAKLGEYRDNGLSCLHIKSISNINKKILEKLIKTSLKDLKKKYK